VVGGWRPRRLSLPLQGGGAAASSGGHRPADAHADFLGPVAAPSVGCAVARRAPAADSSPAARRSIPAPCPEEAPVPHPPEVGYFRLRHSEPQHGQARVGSGGGGPPPKSGLPGLAVNNTEIGYSRVQQRTGGCGRDAPLLTPHPSWPGLTRPSIPFRVSSTALGLHLPPAIPVTAWIAGSGPAMTVEDAVGRVSRRRNPPFRAVTADLVPADYASLIRPTALPKALGALPPSWPGLTRPSIPFSRRFATPLTTPTARRPGHGMDRRVKPGDDGGG
jgi:hypothetical protein